MYQRAVEIDPAYARAYAGMADCWSWIHMYYEASEPMRRRAEEASRRALELDPASAEAHASRGFALSLEKRYPEARAEFARAVALDPTLFEAHYLWGRVCWAEGRLEEAAGHFQNASQVRPDDFQALAMLATVNDGLERHDEARRLYRIVAERIRRHLELYPEDARALYHGALALRRAGEDEEAKAWAERAYAVVGDDSSALYNLGCFHAIGGDIDRAFDCLFRAVDCGFAHREWMVNDADLSSRVRSDPRWEQLLARFG
jgi:tetratricopeptide (TPR) repeat protein